MALAVDNERPVEVSGKRKGKCHEVEKSRKVLEGPMRKWAVKGGSRRKSLTGGSFGEPLDLEAGSILGVNDRMGVNKTSSCSDTERGRHHPGDKAT